MKKIQTFLLLLLFLSYFLPIRLIFAQLSFNEMVPVIDPKAILTLIRIADVLDSILTMTTEELQKLNTQISHIVENQIKEQANKIFTDALKEMTYQEYIAELRKVIEKNEIKNADDIQKDLEEAKIAGAYLGLKEFAQSTSCLNRRIRGEVLYHAANLVSGFDLVNTSREILNQIPDCPTFSSSVSSPLLSFHLFLPFNLGSFMAQLQTSQFSSELSEINIVPAFQDTEDAIEVSEVKNALTSVILGKITEKTEERKKELAEVRPLYETCLRHTFTDNGQVVCLDKKTVIGLADLKKSLENVENPLSQSFENYNIYQQLASSQNILTKLGLTTSSLTISTDIFYSPTTIKEIIYKNCYDYSKDNLTTNNFSIAYLNCLKIFNDKLDHLIKIQQIKLASIKEQVEKNQQELENLITLATNIKSELSNCQAAADDLEDISQKLEEQFNFYSEIFSKIDQFSNQLSLINNQIKNLNSEIDSLLNKLFALSYNVLSYLDNFLGRFQNTLDSDQSIIPDLLKLLKTELPEPRETVLQNVTDFINKFNQVLNEMSGVISNFNSFYVNLNQSDISRSSILDDFYKAEELNQKLEAYKELIESGKCTSQSNLSAQQKPKVIVVESKEKKSFYFSWLKNLIGSRLVELNFKR